MEIRVFFFLFLFASPLLFNVVRCYSDDVEDDINATRDLGIVSDDAKDFVDDSSAPLAPAAGVDTIFLFPKNAAHWAPAGKETELLVGVMNNAGDSDLNVIAIKASLHLPYDHRMLVQNLTVQEFNNASVPFSTQATFPYIFTVHKYLPPGSFDLVGTIAYAVDKNLYESTFYNGTIEVVETGGLLSGETVFLFTLGIAFAGFLGLWLYTYIQNLSKKTKKAPKVEVGTKTMDASLDEWLQGTAYARSVSSSRSKKK